MIALIDYDSGNLRSAQRALLKSGRRRARRPPPRRAERRRRSRAAGRRSVRRLRQRHAQTGPARRHSEYIRTGRPFLGICVGYQALFERSEEFNSCAAGLGVFAGKVVRFPTQPGLKVPQIGWNQLKIVQPDCPIYEGIGPDSYVYFVHSYFPQPTDAKIIATETTYGPAFASSVWRDNVYATQFHPEKSQETGLRLLKNFVALAN